jgi:curved DNA-binding protein CbpA
MQTRSVSYYDVLEVSPQASDDDIKRAYRDLAMRFHPDRNPRNRIFFEHRFRLINEAYSALKTRERRALYDRSIAPLADNDNATGRRASWFSSIAGMFRPAGAVYRNKA